MKKISYILIIILFIFNVVLLFNINNNVEEDKKNKEYLTSLQSFYDDKFIVEKQNESLKLDKNLKLLTIEGDTILVKDIFKSNKIVLKYSLFNCEACIQAEYKILAEFNSVIMDQVCIIAYYDRVRDLIGDYSKLKQIGLDKIPMYLIQNDKFGIPIDEQNTPYYFQINSDLMMSNFFIPIKEKPKLSEYYLKFGLKNFFSNDALKK
ncbi:hypothetical protein [Flavivirga rizhaonensis]|uniref:Redoxin domain-containing protein n=1 Tax=Flavivirga rizhaonensis TaxID=2559571 RepID=A0A4S1E0J9_9FLAO|nr:hypothetical protein [Flavivirga rizhaonensis]TGV03428.1 hypothetical protein EM932_07080 [Flavivirga rizhaonensis]